MAKIKLTKTELKAQTDALKRFQRFLPMLQLKKQQLQAEIAGIVQKAELVSEKEEKARAELASWVGLFAVGGEEMLSGLVKVKSINTGVSNIAGVAIPVFESIDTEVKEIVLQCMEKGLLLINAGAKVIRFVPPLVVTKTDVDKAVKILSDVILNV